MGQIKLYKKFYIVNLANTGSTINQNYISLDPYALSANTFVSSTGSTESSILIEQGLNTIQEIPGVYYTNLNPNLYASDVTYDLIWYVNYTNISPIKKLSTRFRINVNSISNLIEIDYLKSPLEIDYLNSSLEIEVLGKY